MKVAIISSANPKVPESLIPVLQDVISSLHKIKDIEILTGGCLGIPGVIVEKAQKIGIKTIAYSPDKNGNNHNKRLDNQTLDFFSEVKHYKGFTMRSLAMIKDADRVLLLNGRIGTLSEFTIALEEGKRVGVITNTGGIADHASYILQIANKEFPNLVFFSDNPKKVIDWLMS